MIMSKRSDPASPVPNSRAEKLSILSSLLGPEALKRVRSASVPSEQDDGSGQMEVDAERAAWHRNRLLERLRQRGEASGSEAEEQSRSDLPSAEQPHGASPSQRDAMSKVGVGLDARLARISGTDRLDQEHPAIVARLVRGLPRDERIATLKSLPGPLARAVVRRLR